MYPVPFHSRMIYFYPRVSDSSYHSSYHCPPAATLTLSGLSLGDPLSDYPAGIVDGRGGLELHGLHHVALANADFQRQHHHLGRLCEPAERRRVYHMHSESGGSVRLLTVMNERDVGWGGGGIITSFLLLQRRQKRFPLCQIYSVFFLKKEINA